MKKQASHNKLIMIFHEVNDLPFSICRRILKEHHWDYNNFTDSEIDMILTIFATYQVDVSDYYIEDKFLGVEHFYTLKIKSFAPEEEQSSFKNRLRYLLRTNNIGFYVTTDPGCATYNFIRMAPDILAEGLRYYEIDRFIAEVMDLIRYNFFCLNDLKYECEFAGYLGGNHNIHIDIVDSDGNKYKGIMTVDDVYEFRENFQKHVTRISNDVISCFQETYDFIKWASN